MVQPLTTSRPTTMAQPPTATRAITVVQQITTTRLTTMVQPVATSIATTVQPYRYSSIQEEEKLLKEYSLRLDTLLENLNKLAKQLTAAEALIGIILNSYATSFCKNNKNGARKKLNEHHS